jgi:hypothetical protein
MAESVAERMGRFYNSSGLAQKVAAPLKEGAVAEVQFEGDPDSYIMIKEGGKSVFRKGKPAKPQIYMQFSNEAVSWLMEIQGEDKAAIEEYISRFGACILDPTPTRWVKFKLCTNVVTGARMGYFGMMRLGGKKAFDLTIKLGIKIPARFMK